MRPVVSREAERHSFRATSRRTPSRRLALWESRDATLAPGADRVAEAGETEQTRCSVKHDYSYAVVFEGLLARCG